MDKLVDFSQPIVAIMPGGYRLRATVIGEFVGGDQFRLRVESIGEITVGKNGHAFGREIIIRNVAKPSTPSNEELTQRMEKRPQMTCDEVRDMLGYDEETILQTMHDWGFVSDLPKPVDPIDPDIIHARRIIADEYEGGNMPGLAERALSGEMDNRMRLRAALAAIKLGRTLAAGGTAHE